MDCSEPGVFNEKVEWYEGKGFWFEYPVVEFTGGGWKVGFLPRTVVTGVGGSTESLYPSLSAVFDVEAREGRGEARGYEAFIRTTLERLAAEGRKFGALMLEPVVLGAGGMMLV
jgi:dethiobiotin synthetase/adenosylmethionine--8-amino-7-oxononanoate aminotransferase